MNAIAEKSMASNCASPLDHVPSFSLDGDEEAAEGTGIASPKPVWRLGESVEPAPARTEDTHDDDVLNIDELAVADTADTSARRGPSGRVDRRYSGVGGLGGLPLAHSAPQAQRQLSLATGTKGAEPADHAAAGSKTVGRWGVEVEIEVSPEEGFDPADGPSTWSGASVVISRLGLGHDEARFEANPRLGLYGAHS